jgi:predicted glutamate--cysteine ligase
MRNVRHLWTSVRPNGEERPQRLNRLEIRICDLIADPLQLLAVTAFAELRVHALLADPAGEDPLRSSRLDLRELAELADANDRAAARLSLDASLRHWRDGAALTARDWIAASLEAMVAPAAERGLTGLLTPLHALLAEGNTAMRWLELYRQGEPVGAILGREARALEQRERSLEADLAADAACVLG